MNQKIYQAFCLFMLIKSEINMAITELKNLPNLESSIVSCSNNKNIDERYIEQDQETNFFLGDLGDKDSKLYSTQDVIPFKTENPNILEDSKETPVDVSLPDRHANVQQRGGNHTVENTDPKAKSINTCSKAGHKTVEFVSTTISIKPANKERFEIGFHNNFSSKVNSNTDSTRLPKDNQLNSRLRSENSKKNLEALQGSKQEQKKVMRFGKGTYSDNQTPYESEQYRKLENPTRPLNHITVTKNWGCGTPQCNLYNRILKRKAKKKIFVNNQNKRRRQKERRRDKRQKRNHRSRINK